MLINCPRCGFQQPKDKYCAQCGVDIESFRPVTPPLWKRFFSSSLTQASVLSLAAVGVGFYIYKSGALKKEATAKPVRQIVQINTYSKNRAAPTEQAPPIEVVESASNQAQSASAEPASGFAASSPDENPVAGDAMDAKALSARSANPAEGEKSKDRTLAKTSSPQLVVHYAEVDRRVLSSVYESSRRTGQFMSFGEYTAGILPDINKRLSSSLIQVLHKEIRSLDSGKSLQWSYGLKDRVDPSVEIGLTTFFEIGELEINNLRGNLEIQRTWREQSPHGGFEIQRKSFPAIFEINDETGFFMSGVMPTHSNLENDDALTSIDIYQILKSTKFRSGESDFVIFIEFEKGQ